jgi:hypothetical protein
MKTTGFYNNPKTGYSVWKICEKVTVSELNIGKVTR